MQLDLYKYEKDGVQLEFSFKKGDKNLEQKITFLELLKEATSELDKEIGQQAVDQ